jgi:hypothetical protein
MRNFSVLVNILFGISISACTAGIEFGNKPKDSDVNKRKDSLRQKKSGDALATCAGNPDDEKKPCFNLHLNGLSKIAKKVRLKKSHEDKSGVIVDLKGQRTHVSISSESAADGLTVELLDKDEQLVDGGQLKIDAERIKEEESTTIFDKHVFANDESVLEAVPGDIEDVDKDTLDRINKLATNTFKAVAPKSGSGFDRTYSLATFRSDGLVSYDVAFSGEAGDINQGVVTSDGSIYGVTNHGLFQVSPNGAIQEIVIDSKLDLSWLSGVAYDVKRNRLVVSTSHVYSHLAAYDLKTKKWTKLYETRDHEIRAVTYIPKFDSLFYMSRGGPTERYTMVGVDAETGKSQYKVRLPSSFPDTGYFAQEVVSFGFMGDFVAMVVSMPSNSSKAPSLESNSATPELKDQLVIYLLDPTTRRLVKTRSAGWELEYDRVASISTGSCGETESNYTNPPRPDAASIAAIVSTYEASGGRVKLLVPAAEKPWDLLLTSYEKVEWELSVAEGAKIKRIQAISYSGATVKGAPEGTSLTVSSYEQGNNNGPLYYIGPWESTSGSSDHSFVEDITNARKLLDIGVNQERIFQYCYRTMASIDLKTHLDR